MSEELTLLPCPNPYCTADKRPRIWATGVDCMTQFNHGVQCECGTGIASMTRKDAIDIWNALLRSLTWTDEPPKVPGYYWHRCEEGVVTMRRVWKGDIETPSKIPQQWAGPIPEPHEPQ